MKHTDRKGFIEYVNEHAPFIEILTTTEGTIFLSIGGFDGGNVFADGLEGNQFDGKMNIISKVFNTTSPETAVTLE